MVDMEWREGEGYQKEHDKSFNFVHRYDNWPHIVHSLSACLANGIVWLSVHVFLDLPG